MKVEICLKSRYPKKKTCTQQSQENRAQGVIYRLRFQAQEWSHGRSEKVGKKKRQVGKKNERKES